MCLTEWRQRESYFQLMVKSSFSRANFADKQNSSIIICAAIRRRNGDKNGKVENS